MLRPRSLAFLAAALLAAACSDRAPTRPLLKPTAAQKNESPVSPTDTSGLVALPSGLYHRSCVHGVPNGGKVDADGVIRTADGQVVPHPICVSPGPVMRGSPELARSPWARGPNSWTAPTLDHYMESGTAASGSGHVFRRMSADWTVPAKPISYSSGNIIFLFPSIENNIGLSTSSIAQPVLQLGNNGFHNPGNNWVAALYICESQASCFTSQFAVLVSPGDHLSGLVYASNCSAGKCDWNLSLDNVTQNWRLSMTVTAGMASHGGTNDTYTATHAGALEVYNITTCDGLPAGPFTFNNFIYENESGSITPTFNGNVTGGLSPQCGFGATGGSSSVVLADSATTWVAAGITGPAVITSGDNETWSASITAPHLGYPPYTYAWSGVLSGNGSSVTGSPASTGFLYLTVQDSHGFQSTTQIYISVCQPGQPLPC